MSTLYQQICDYENLHHAFLRARQGKRHQESVARFERRLEAELFQLQEELLARTYRPGPYRSFYHTEAKRRLISAAPFRDRVVHHALVQVIEPKFERRIATGTTPTTGSTTSVSGAPDNFHRDGRMLRVYGRQRAGES